MKNIPRRSFLVCLESCRKFDWKIEQVAATKSFRSHRLFPVNDAGITLNYLTVVFHGSLFMRLLHAAPPYNAPVILYNQLNDSWQGSDLSHDILFQIIILRVRRGLSTATMYVYID